MVLYEIGKVDTEPLLDLPYNPKSMFNHEKKYDTYYVMIDGNHRGHVHNHHHGDHYHHNHHEHRCICATTQKPSQQQQQQGNHYQATTQKPSQQQQQQGNHYQQRPGGYVYAPMPRRHRRSKGYRSTSTWSRNAEATITSQKGGPLL